MQWEYMVPADFKKAVNETGLCVIPVGSLERHGEHLPYGCDMLIAKELAVRASEIEPAIVFPSYFMMQVHEASCFAGTVNYPQAFAIEAFGLLLESIAKNGFKKILVVNAHGGNKHMLEYFAMSRMDETDDYIFYHVDVFGLLNKDETETMKSLTGNDNGFHAGDLETSLFMVCCPGKIKLKYIPHKPVGSLNRLKHLQDNGVHNALWWYANYPENINGNPSLASEKKGKAILDIYTKALARAIRVVKEDTVTAHLRTEFLEKVKNKEK